MNESTTAGFSAHHVLCASPCGLHRMAYTEWAAKDNPDNPRVLLCVHGLARNGRDFDELARSLSADYRVICPDIVGRGQSDWLCDPAYYGIQQYVADLMVLIARLNVDSVHWLGTSMGGLIGMVVASLPKTPVTRLILNDVGPAIAPESLKRIGEYLGRAPSFSSLAEAEQYIRVVSAPFGRLTDSQWRHLTETSLRCMPDGRFTMRYDPGIAESFRRATAGEPFNLWPIYDGIRCPTLLLRGAQSDLLTHATVQEMAARGPRPKVVEVPDVGHAPMFMDDTQIALVRDFLRDAG